MSALENADRIRQALARLPTAKPSGSKSGMAAAVWLRTTVNAPGELLMAAIAYRFVSEKRDRGRLYRISESRSAG